MLRFWCLRGAQAPRAGGRRRRMNRLPMLQGPCPLQEEERTAFWIDVQPQALNAVCPLFG
jgi:hypothetical protein